MSETVVLLYDTDQRRPACALLQAVAGGDHHFLSATFPAKTWLVSPTPGMKRLAATREQWRGLAGRAESTP